MRTGKKWLRFTCLMLCVVLFCCSCGAADPIGSGGTQMNMPYIGVVLKSTDNPYFALIKAGAEYEADRIGAQVVFAAPEKEDNVKEQAELVESMSKLKVSVIIVSPSNEQSITEQLEKAKNTGKHILTVDTSSDFEGCDGYIGTAQYDAAYKQGAYAAKLVADEEDAKAVILRGADGDKTHMLREYGLEDALTRDGGVPVYAVEYGDCKEDKAEDIMEELLEKDKKTKEIRVVCTTSDSMAVGAQRAIAESGRDDIHIVSFDGMIDASELVRVGEIDAVFAQDPFEMGKQCIDYAVKLCNGESDGESVHTDVELITSDNAEAHIEQLQRELDHWDGK